MIPGFPTKKKHGLLKRASLFRNLTCVKKQNQRVQQVVIVRAMFSQQQNKTSFSKGAVQADGIVGKWDFPQ